MHVAAETRPGGGKSVPGHLSVAAAGARFPWHETEPSSCFSGRASEGETSAEGAQGALRSGRLQQAAAASFISSEVLVRLRGNETDDSRGTSRPGRSKRSLGRHRSIISCLTPRNAPAANTSRLPACLLGCAALRARCRGRRAGGEPRDGVFKGQARP